MSSCDLERPPPVLQSQSGSEYGDSESQDDSVRGER